jgi:predicted CXXCH cytochrome family protein
MNSIKPALLLNVLTLVQVAVTLFLFILPAAAATTPASNGEKSGTAVPTAFLDEEAAGKEEYRRGPHKQLECPRCHGKGSEQQPPAEESVTGNSIRLCLDCHPVAHIHPVGIAPRSLAGEGRTFSLPLGKGALQGQIVCHTCHAIHQHENNPFLLRGQTQPNNRERNFVCFHCHPDQFAGKFPHTGDESSCGFCHVSRPQQKEGRTAPPDPRMQAACLLCHSNLTDAHFAGANPFIDAAIRERADEAGIFFADGWEVCTTCHNPHGGKNERYLLRNDYLALCEDSRALNPHWNNYLCKSCHREAPVKGHAPLREEGDKVNLCNRCHHSGYARPDIHPVGVIPSQHIRIPENLPLQDGKLSCETCHDSLLQMGTRRSEDAGPANPNFLRSGQGPRNAFCFLCHIEETYKRLNPHNQLNEQGKIVEKTCLFCHASIPDVSFIGPEKVSFIVLDPNEYCIGCHPGFTSKHPAGVDHLIEPSKKIMVAIQTSVQRIGVELPLFKGKIFCATCHNPHQEGVIKIAAAATGTKLDNKLRLKPGRNQSAECIGCHFDK